MSVADAGKRDTRLVELTREECLGLLASASVGRIAVQLGDGAPVIRPVNHRFDAGSQSVVFRTGAGSKLSALRASTRAAFEVDDLDSVTRTGWSVIVLGVVTEVTAATEVARLQRDAPASWVPGQPERWVALRAETVSGRRIVPA